MKKLLVVSALALALSATSHAQEQTKENDKWVAGFVEYYATSKDGNGLSGFLEDGIGFGGEFGVKYNPDWAARFELSYLKIDVTNEFLDERGVRFGADALYFLEEDLYVFGGLKLTEIVDGDPMANVGLGKHWKVGQYLDLGKHWKYADNIQLVTEVAAYHALASDNSYTHLGVKLGLSYAFGGTTAPSMPRDGDNDGVFDSKDQCLNTPAGTPVDVTGCNLDLDGDGVINRLDNCPNTPAGTQVDSYGCNNDLDGDGIPNSIDRCVNTVVGTPVGAKGCSLVLDTDQDGVLDDVDNCANTPMTDKVDDRGCSIFTEEEASINIKVLFGNNSSVIGNPNDAQFEDFANFMKRYPDTDTVIEGHASAPGNDDYNLMLSQKRANAVRTLLINKYGINPARLTAVGFGETQLLDTSNTAAANKVNRRITARVTASEKVKVAR